ncbi:MAG: hypothetical protein ACP5IE_09220, partial [Infirmifilum sp.]
PPPSFYKLWIRGPCGEIIVDIEGVGMAVSWLLAPSPTSPARRWLLHTVPALCIPALDASARRGRRL